MADNSGLNPADSLNQAQVKRLTAVHGWSGVILGLVLYVVVVTGTVVVFREEIASWSVGGERGGPPLAAQVDVPVRAIAEQTPKGYLSTINIYPNERGELTVVPYSMVMNAEEGRPRPYGSLYWIDPATGEPLARHDGFIYDAPEMHATSALEDFLVDLHIALYLPHPWGSILTGIMGLLTMAAGITGFLMHRHLIRDLFVAARPGLRLVSARDRHILAASWGLPFAFLLGFTGSFYSFAGTISLPLVAQTAFGGDMAAAREVLFRPHAKPDPRPAETADLDAVIARSTREAGTPAAYLRINNWGRADGRISVYHRPAAGGLAFRHNVFEAATGTFLGVKPLVGNQPSFGGDLYALIRPLHFGDFAGVLSESVWVGLGSAMAYVIISGLRLWVRRREDDPLWRGFGKAVTTTAYGLPLAMAVSAHAYFAGLAWGDPYAWTPWGFFAAALACILFGAVTDADRLASRFRRLLALACLTLPVLRMAMGGIGWAEALARGQGAVFTVDLAFLALGGGLWLWANRAETPSRAGAPLAEPAE